MQFFVNFLQVLCFAPFIFLLTQQAKPVYNAAIDGYVECCSFCFSQSG